MFENKRSQLPVLDEFLLLDLIGVVLTPSNEKLREARGDQFPD